MSFVDCNVVRAFEIHAILHLLQEQLVRDRARMMNSSGNIRSSASRDQFADAGTRQAFASQDSVGIASLQRNSNRHTTVGSELTAKHGGDANRSTVTGRNFIESSVDEPTVRNDSGRLSSVSSQPASKRRQLNGVVDYEMKSKPRETDIDSDVDFHSTNNTCGRGRSKGHCSCRWCITTPVVEAGHSSCRGCVTTRVVEVCHS
jgi:hypothetical protein